MSAVFIRSYVIFVVVSSLCDISISLKKRTVRTSLLEELTKKLDRLKDGDVLSPKTMPIGYLQRARTQGEQNRLYRKYNKGYKALVSIHYMHQREFQDMLNSRTAEVKTIASLLKMYRQVDLYREAHSLDSMESDGISLTELSELILEDLRDKKDALRTERRSSNNRKLFEDECSAEELKFGLGCFWDTSDTTASDTSVDGGGALRARVNALWYNLLQFRDRKKRMKAKFKALDVNIENILTLIANVYNVPGSPPHVIVRPPESPSAASGEVFDEHLANGIAGATVVIVKKDFIYTTAYLVQRGKWIKCNGGFTISTEEYAQPHCKNSESLSDRPYCVFNGAIRKRSDLNYLCLFLDARNGRAGECPGGGLTTVQKKIQECGKRTEIDFRFFPNGDVVGLQVRHRKVLTVLTKEVAEMEGGTLLVI